MIVPFNAKFSTSDKDYDPFIDDKLMSEESMNYLLKIAIDGLRRVIINRKFTKSDAGELEKTDYVMSNNNVLEWFDECPTIENNGVGDMYLITVWCKWMFSG